MERSIFYVLLFLFIITTNFVYSVPNDERVPHHRVAMLRTAASIVMHDADELSLPTMLLLLATRIARGEIKRANITKSTPGLDSPEH